MRPSEVKTRMDVFKAASVAEQARCNALERTETVITGMTDEEVRQFGLDLSVNLSGRLYRLSQLDAGDCSGVVRKKDTDVEGCSYATTTFKFEGLDLELFANLGSGGVDSYYLLRLGDETAKTAPNYLVHNDQEVLFSHRNGHVVHVLTSPDDSGQHRTCVSELLDKAETVAFIEQACGLAPVPPVVPLETV